MGNGHGETLVAWLFVLIPMIEILPFSCFFLITSLTIFSEKVLTYA